MDKENGETSESGTGSSKLSNPPDPASLLDAANLFGAYWPRTDASTTNSAASLFAAAGGTFGPLGPHPSLPFGLLPTAAAAGRGVPSFPPVSSAAAYQGTLSVAASQAASLGINPAATAWWSMASQLDYLARLQASGLNFPGLSNPGDLAYSSLGLPALSHHKSSKNSSKSSSLSKGSGGSKGKTSATALSLQAGAKLDGRLDPTVSKSSSNTGNSASLYNKSSQKLPSKQSSAGLSSSSLQSSAKSQVKKPPSLPSPKPPLSSVDKTDGNYGKQSLPKSSTPKSSQATPCSSSSIFTSPLSLVSNSSDKSSSGVNTLTTQSLVNSSVSCGIPPNILSAALEGSDPSSILGGVRLPPDTEIIKYTSSIVGPKIPGTTNRGRKKTISLDPPSVSVMPTHSSTGMLIERGSKWAKLNQEPQDLSTSNDRVEVIKLPATNGSPSGINIPAYNTNSDQSNDAPLNLSLKPSSSTSSTNCQSNSLNSLSTLSANIGSDRISRRKPGPKPRRVIQSPSPLSSSSIPGAPSASLNQLFAAADSPRPPSRNDDSDNIASTPTSSSSTASQSQNHKDGRPRNLGRGVSKPKKNTVASLLAQSRALGIKPVQIDPNTPMNQQISMLKSNMLAAQFMAEAGDDKLLQEKFRGALSDSSNLEVSTDSDNLTDSNHTDSECETDANGVSNPKKRRQFNERELRLPLEHGWKRETIIRGLTRHGGIKGDVCYTPPETTSKLKQLTEISQYLEQAGNTELTRDNFTFSCKIILGDYLQKPPPGATSEGEYLRMSEEEVAKRLEDLRSVTRSNLAVEQRIEVARRQQAARAAARIDREHARLAREIEKNEKQEAAKRDREVRSQQLMEGRKRLAFTLEQKIQIISEIEGGRTKSDVSRELGLASSTVATIWKNRDHILNAYGTDIASNDAEFTVNQKAKNHMSLSDSGALTDSLMARRKRHEELGRQRLEDQQRKIQEREMKKQQAAILKEQMYIQELNKQREMLYTVELERERRRQHMALVKALEGRRRLEERERKKQQAILEKQASKERRMEQRRIDMEILTELRKPCEDMELTQKPLPEFPRIHGLRLSGQAFANILMVFEFLHTFGETLGFDMESLPCLDSLQQALLNESLDAEEELLSVMTHLLVCAIEDPGIPNPARHTTILGQSLRQADITHSNLSEILRIYLYANATGEVKSLTGKEIKENGGRDCKGVHFERDREKRVADHYQNCSEMQQTQVGKNAAYYELLHENATWRMSDSLKDKPFLSLSPTDKAAMLAFLCNELLQNKAVIRQIDGSLDTVAQLKKERWLLDTKIRKLRMMTNRKLRTEAAEKMQAQLKVEGVEGGATPASGEATPRGVDSPAPTPTPHKDDLLVDDEEEISENESEGTQPEEEEDKKLSGEELSKKLDKLLKTSEAQLQSLNHSVHQLRATCYGQDRYWRRYWSLPTAGGIFVEAMESAQPEVLAEQLQEAENTPPVVITSVEDIKHIVPDADNIQDPSADKEVSQIVGNETNEPDNNEHRKTPNRVEEIKTENDVEMKEPTTAVDGESQNDVKEENNIVVVEQEKNANEQTSDLQTNKIKTELDDIEEHIPSKLVQKPVSKNFNLFEKLGECMEKENKSIESSTTTTASEEPMKVEEKAEVKVEVKEEVKTEIVVEIKTEVKMETDEEKPVVEAVESKWFSILSRDGSSTCDGVNMTSGNRWDTNTVGACMRENFGPELKIPVFPPPNCSNSYISCISCDSPGPLQMSSEESVQLEYIKLHGPPKRLEKVLVPVEMRTGWWRITDVDQLKLVIEHLHTRGVRERELKRTIQTTMQSMYECAANVQIEDGNHTAADLTDCPEANRIIVTEAGTSVADKPGAWNPAVATRVDFSVLEQVEALEDKVANASMQVKGWKVPNRDSEEVTPGQAVPLAKERLASLEAAIERRYLKPPLGVSTGDANLAAIAQEACMNSQQQQQQQQQSPASMNEDIPKGLSVWRDAVQRSQTSAQMAMCLYMLEASIAWDKSIMKANCQFCHSGDNEDKLLLCDSCDKGYHTYCFKPKMETIPEGNWYCHECINKVTGERNCIVCGKKQSTGRLVLCDLCPRAYHQDCLTPPLNKVPRGKWYCPNCHSKQPKKRNSRRSNNKTTRDSESSDHPPTSPAPSHSSITTNEEQQSNHQQTSSSTPAQLNQQQAKDVQQTIAATVQQQQQNASPSTSSTQRKDRVSKKLQKELAPCKTLLEELECHDDAWPFLLPVNTKQFPTYKKIITSPMDLSTIKKRLQDLHYKSREEFCIDVRQIFDNCETFNEDDSPVGKAGHCMRQFFEARWNELCPPHPGKS